VSSFVFKPKDLFLNDARRSQCLRNFLGDLTFIDQKSSLLAVLNTSKILLMPTPSISLIFLMSFAQCPMLGFLVAVVALIISYIDSAICICCFLNAFGVEQFTLIFCCCGWFNRARIRSCFIDISCSSISIKFMAYLLFVLPVSIKCNR
jgi:hypothetical protein